MASQIARLYLRGSICNVTMRSLSPEQRKKVGDVLEQVLQDPLLQPARQAFITALANTIGNEYKDPSFAMQEVAMAVWRATVSALYHKPMPEVIENPKQRKKFYQEWIFNSLRQILNENKPARVRSTQTVTGLNTELAKQMILNFLGDYNVFIGGIVQKSNRYVIINAEVMRLPATALPKLWKIHRFLRRYGLKLLYFGKQCNSVHIIADQVKIVEAQMPLTTNIKMVSFESGDQSDNSDGVRYKLEYKLACTKGIAAEDHQKFDDSIRVMRTNLPTDAQQALDIMVSPPPEYVEKHGDDLCQSTIGRFLKKTPKEIAKIFELLRAQCLAMRLGVEG
jgi:hypothetical protein